MPTPAHIRSTIATIASPPEDLRAMASYHKALADPTRLRLLQRLAERLLGFTGRGEGLAAEAVALLERT